MKTSTLPYDDFFELTGACGAAIGILKAAADGAPHATPEKLREIAERLGAASMNALKNSDTYDPLPVGFPKRT